MATHTVSATHASVKGFLLQERKCVGGETMSFLKRETMKQQAAADEQLGEEENQWDRCLCRWILV